MPTIFDNIDTPLLPTLRNTLAGGSTGLDVCVGYFNLRGWQSLSDLVDVYPGTEEGCCRLIVGMQRPPHDLMKRAQSLQREEYLDGPTVARLQREIARTFREQLEFGLPSAQAEATLRQLACHLREHKLRVRLFLAHPLHAKLYLIRRTDQIVPRVAYLGSSNLTFSGLSGQGELNVDVVEGDATTKLQEWFDARWNDRLAFDISDDLATWIETSWAREELVKPYHVYLKMATHLCQEAREGEREFPMPAVFKGVLLDFQERAVSLVAHALHRRGGVLLGDVVGLGKTLMATAVARIFQDDDHSNTLVICPPKLVSMWEWHLAHYGIAGKVMSVGRVSPGMESHLPRFRLVIVDESHNLRNREGKRYTAIRDYINHSEARVLLLTATPYNKHFTDLSNQLRLFLNDQRDLRVRPEAFFQEWNKKGYNDADFIARFQASPGSLRAFDQSPYPDDWRDLMRLFLVRRTRQFIMRNYATFDEQRQRYYLTVNGQPSYIPVRQPKTLTFALDEDDPTDQYAQLYRADVVQVIEELALPRYGLMRYLNTNAAKRANPGEQIIIDNLNRAGRRLIGFCRTGLFKRLESSGWSFLLSLERHILRNLITLHALEQGVPVPIGTQDAAMLDTAVSDEDSETVVDETDEVDDTGDAEVLEDEAEGVESQQMAAYRTHAAAVYQSYWDQFRNRFNWLDGKFFVAALKKDLRSDTERLLKVLNRVRDWQVEQDTKLHTLAALLTETHPDEKVLIFTQFADTAAYLAEHLQILGVGNLGVATGNTNDPTTLARRFSPSSNGGLRTGETALRVLIATDVLGEGQNLQDAHIVVNYDLPWAIIRLIQRVGRIDRIGQQADTISAYSFMPAEGVEKIINLRARLYDRLQQNQEVIGTDESFFGEAAANQLARLYTEDSQVLNEDGEEDNDLASVALQIWNSATEADRKAANALPPVIAATRALSAAIRTGTNPPGAITYLRFPDGTDALVRVDADGNLVSQSITSVFRAAACGADTPALPRTDNHYDLVTAAVQLAVQEQVNFGGQLGSLRSVRRQVYEAVKRYREQHQQRPTLFSGPILEQLPPIMDMLRQYPLKEAARASLRRQMRLGMPDEQLIEMVMTMHAEERLCTITEETTEAPEPQIVCSLGLVPPESGAAAEGTADD